MVYNIGIVDDDATKITQLITYLRLGWNDEEGIQMAEQAKEKYKDVKLNPMELELKDNLTEMVKKVYESKLDALIIDYKLSSQQNISYTGIELVEAIQEKLFQFPIFVLTSYQDDLFLKECFDVYQVFEFDRYINDKDERIELNSKIVEQIKKYRNSILSWKKELFELLPNGGKNCKIDERIIELDTRIEKSIDGVSSLSEKMKADLGQNRIQTLIDKIDKLIDKE